MEGQVEQRVERAGVTWREGRWNTIGVHLVALVAVQLVLVAVTIVMGAREDFRNARRDASSSVATIAHLAADRVADALDEDRSTMDQVPAFADLFATDAVCQFAGQDEDDWTEEGLFRSSFSLIRADGSSMCPGVGDAPDADITEQAWFAQATTTLDPVEFGPVADRKTGKQEYIFAVQVPNHGSLVVITVDLSSAGQMLGNRFGRTGPDPSFVLTTGDRSVDLGGTDGATSGDIVSDAYIHAEADVPELGWKVIAGVSTNDAFAASRESLRERVFLAVVVVFLVLAAAMVLSRRFARPIRALAKVTRNASDGDLGAGVVPTGPSELQELGKAYNEMIAVRRSAEAALRKAYRAERKAADELRELDEMRQAFLRAISHELRTPLTSVVGYSTFLSESMDDLGADEVKTSIDSIASQSKRLERLLLDLLDVERLERGIVEPNLISTDIAPLVMRVIERSSASERIRADVKERVKANVDPALVERILENLVFNAAKHTPSDARIWVRARRANGHLRLSVEDSGDGVPDELKDAIFEPFKQGNVPSHSPGTGVGLNLVAQFAKLHGGRAWVEDRRGGGAAFRVELPAKAAAKGRRAA